MERGIRLLLTNLAILVLCTGCDPVHNIKLENNTNKDVEILIGKSAYSNERSGFEEIKYKGRIIDMKKIKPNDFVHIGTVVARHQPKMEDIEIDFLEIRMNSNDTITLIGKGAIF